MSLFPNNLILGLNYLLALLELPLGILKLANLPLERVGFLAGGDGSCWRWIVVPILPNPETLKCLCQGESLTSTTGAA